MKDTASERVCVKRYWTEGCTEWSEIGASRVQRAELGSVQGRVLTALEGRVGEKCISVATACGKVIDAGAGPVRKTAENIS